MKYFKKLIGERIYLSPKGTSEEEIQKVLQNSGRQTESVGKEK